MLLVKMIEAKEISLETYLFDIFSCHLNCVCMWSDVCIVPSVEMLVLDEADKLFEMGLLEQTDTIMAACTHKDVRAAFVTLSCAHVYNLVILCAVSSFIPNFFSLAFFSVNRSFARCSVQRCHR